MDAMPDDAGVGDGGANDCFVKCSSVYIDSCGTTTVRSCSTLARTGDRWFVRCDLDHHRVCMPNGAVCGRRPAGLPSTTARGDSIRSPLAGLLSRMASLEAASVPAFRMLARELDAHGAPASLRRAARRAAADEVRHARIMSRLARRHGGSADPVRLPRRGVRPLSEVAIENCVEGCVRETFGALVATWQAREARDPAFRRAMGSIARDEARHAALAFQVADWMSARLDRDGKRCVERERKRALSELRREFAWEPPPEVVAAAGFPRRRDAHRLLDEMALVLWGAGRDA
jgi:hypothetical protein